MARLIRARFPPSPWSLQGRCSSHFPATTNALERAHHSRGSFLVPSTTWSGRVSAKSSRCGLWLLLPFWASSLSWIERDRPQAEVHRPPRLPHEVQRDEGPRLVASHRHSASLASTQVAFAVLRIALGALLRDHLGGWVERDIWAPRLV